MESNTCKVCGGSDMNLVDGYYYCVECGTQDTNIQERIVDTEAFIGIATKTTRARVRKPKEKMKMSPEWCKWHAYNFIIAGLTDELIAVGAKTTVKTKILWIWTKYIKHFKVKEDQPKSHFLVSEDGHPSEDGVDTQSKSNQDHNETDAKDIDDGGSDDDNVSIASNCEEEFAPARKKRMISLIDNVHKGVIIAILYIALNLDKSDIQLSHLLRYVKWGYVNISQCDKYIPKDLNPQDIPGFGKFRFSCALPCHSHTIRRTAYALYKFLDLGIPIVPDIRKIIEDTTKELCLPHDFKDLVISLMHQYPTRFATMSKCFQRKIVIPDYELLCLTYFAIAFKLCFGLDDEYETRLSDVVDKINNENNYDKSLKMGSFSNATDRLFSFRDWCEHMRVKKMIVCKHNLEMARLFKYDVADQVFMEHINVPTKPTSLITDIVKDILNKIPVELNMPVIPKNEFDLKFTPMSSCADVILDYIQDPEMRIMLSEDFSQYSLEYATRKLRLIDEGSAKNIVIGVSDNKKIIHGNATSEFAIGKSGYSKMMYIRFCDSKTVPEHSSIDEPEKTISDVNANSILNRSTDSSDKINDNETDTSALRQHDDSKISCAHENSKFEEIIDNEQRAITFVDYPNACIYDDDSKDDVKGALDSINDSFGAFGNDRYFNDYAENYLSSPKDKTIVDDDEVPQIIDRKAMISELIKKACETYKITLPPHKDNKRNIERLREKRKARQKPRILPNPEILHGNNISKNDSTIFLLLSSYYKNILPEKHSSNQESEDVYENFESILDFTFREDLEPPANANDPSLANGADLSLPDVGTSFNDCEIQDDQGDKNDELEHLLDSDEEESDEEYILPEIAQEGTNVDLDKAVEKILEKETNRSGAPPKKKIKVMRNKFDKSTDKNEKFLHSSAWGVKNFNYWTRHYLATTFTKDIDKHERFNFELHHHLPKNFVQMLQICASVIDCSPFRLYKKIQSLEKTILKRLQQNK